MSWQRYCIDAEGSQRAGEELSRLLLPGDIVLLSGNLGAGKTTFTKGVARGLGVTDRVTSPTFTMVRQHDCRNDLGITTLHHCDVYRINSADEVMDLSLGELVEEQGIALVEWGELAASVFGRNVLTIDFVIDDNDGRMLTVSGDASHGREEALAEWSSL